MINNPSAHNKQKLWSLSCAEIENMKKCEKTYTIKLLNYNKNLRLLYYLLQLH